VFNEQQKELSKHNSKIKALLKDKKPDLIKVNYKAIH
jgi:hypothetical protein